MQENELTLVIPCYNEGMNIDFLHTEIVKLFANIRNKLEIVFVDDGSTDETLTTMKEVAIKSIFKIRIISFSRNFGKEAAIYAGLKESRGKYTVIIDADLQQNPKYIIDMKKILDDNPDIDVVAAYPAQRKENPFKAFAKKNFYKMMNKMSEIELRDSASDFRIFRRNVLEAILAMSEKQRFTKGIFSWIGFSTYYYPYQVEKRVIGKSKWNFKNLFDYAMDGLVDYSKKPLLYAVYMGMTFVILSIITFVIILVLSIIGTFEVANAVWIAILMVCLCGFLLMSNGVVGYYLYKTLIEVKNRPIYIVKKKFENEAIPANFQVDYDDGESTDYNAINSTNDSNVNSSINTNTNANANVSTNVGDSRGSGLTQRIPTINIDDLSNNGNNETNKKEGE